MTQLTCHPDNQPRQHTHKHVLLSFQRVSVKLQLTDMSMQTDR